MLKYALPLLSLLALPLAQAHDYQLADLHIDHPWSRAMPPNAPAGAAYFLVENRVTARIVWWPSARRAPARANCTTMCMKTA